MSAGTANFGPMDINSADDSISKGEVRGEESILIQGVNPDMTADVREDIWPSGGLFVYMPSPDTMDYASTDAADSQLVFVSGVLEGLTVTETILLNGLTPVAGVQNFDVINFMFLLSGDTNAGNVEATASIHGTVQASMRAEQGLTQMGVHRLESNHNIIIRQVEFNVAKTAAGQQPLVLFNLYARFNATSPWISILDRRIDASVQNDVVVPYPVSGIITAGADLRFSAISSQSNTQASMRLTGVQYDV